MVHSRRSAAGTAMAVAGVVAAAAWAVIRSGPTVTPSLAQIHAAAVSWPTRLPGEFEGFYTDSPVGLLLARALGLDATGYLRLSTLVAILVVGAWACWAALASTDGQRARAARLAVLAPVTGVLFAWLGFYDSYTMLAWALALFAWYSQRRWLLVLAGVLLGFQHFEHALLGGVALVLTWLAVRDALPARLGSTNPAWLVPGIVAGKVLLVIALIASGGSASGRTGWLSGFLVDWTKTAVNTGPMLLWSLFAGTWAVVVALWLSRGERRSRLLLLAAFAVGIASTLVSGDRPRVFVIVLAPALLVATVAYLRAGTASRRELILVETVVWLAPTVTLWGAAVVYGNVLDQAITTAKALLP